MRGDEFHESLNFPESTANHAKHAKTFLTRLEPFGKRRKEFGAAEGPRGSSERARASPFHELTRIKGLKARKKIAQGNALGLRPTKFSQALKGRQKPVSIQLQN